VPPRVSSQNFSTDPFRDETRSRYGTSLQRCSSRVFWTRLGFAKRFVCNKIASKALNPAFSPPVASFLFLINKRHNLVYFRMEVSESFCLLADEDLCLSQEFSRLFFEKTGLCFRRKSATLTGMRKSQAGWFPARFFYNVIMINKILNGAQSFESRL